jgi:MFS family permease
MENNQNHFEVEDELRLLRILVLSTQLLDSSGAGIFGTLQILVTSDLSNGTGRFSFMMGMVSAAMCLGATVSGYLGQALAQDYGYAYSFAALGAISILPLVLYALGMPETVPESVRTQRRERQEEERRQRVKEMWRSWNESKKRMLASDYNPFGQCQVDSTPNTSMHYPVHLDRGVEDMHNSEWTQSRPARADQSRVVLV